MRIWFHLAILASAVAAVELPDTGESAECTRDALSLSDFGRDFEACLRLAKEGNPLAQYNLGEMYIRGLGVPLDYAEGSVWLRRASDQGFAPAETALGQMFEQGQGMPVNQAEAAAWYRRAADQGYAEAQHKLGMQYAEGRGVLRDYVLAYMWLSLSGNAAEASAYVDRATVIKRMSQEQVETAHQLVRSWKPTSP